MKNPNYPDALWKQLDGGLWHATDFLGLEGIAQEKQVNVSTAPRYENSFCRLRNSVSLFDFGDTALDQTDFMAGNWFKWLGKPHSGSFAVWLAVDRQSVKDRLMDAGAVRKAWALEEAYNTKFFTGVEACHSGAISERYINGALIIDSRNLTVFKSYSAPLSRIVEAAKAFAQVDRLASKHD